MIPYLTKLADFANKFIDRLEEVDCIGIYGFSDDLQELLPIARRSRITDSVKIYGRGSSTALYKSIVSAIDRLGTIRKRKAVILFSDGKDTFGGLNSKDVLSKVSESDTSFYVLQFGDATISKNPYYDPGENAYPSGDTLTSSDRIISRRDLRILGADTRQKKINEFMTQLAEKTGGRYFRSAEIEDFQKAFDNILQDLSAKYYLYYYPASEPKRGEQRSIRIKVLKNEMSVTSRTSVLYKQ
jgi:VWFA-related protein